MSKIEVNTVAPQCGTTLTLGESGDTVTLGSGASQSGFGRTGTVDWDTTPKTATFSAVSGDGFFCNTTSSAFTCNLPAGSAGAIVSLADYAGTWDSNALTVSPNGSEKIGGVNADVVLNTEGQSVTFVYVDGTQGWLNVQDSTSNERGNAFVAATGGTITTCGNFKVHTFTGPGTFTVTSAGTPAGSTTVDYVVVAGGGGGGGGGGGAGGFRLSNSVGCIPAPAMSPLVAPNSPTPAGLPVSVQGYPITVGGGGTGGLQQPPSTFNAGGNGNPSVFSTITSTAGGGGGSPNGACVTNGGGKPGGSGGGAGHDSACRSVATGNTPPVSPPQGQNGGITTVNSYGAGAGGGGAGAVGSNQQSPNNIAGGGGTGSFVSPIFAGCNGTPGPAPSVRYFAGGGGGGNNTGTGTGFSHPAGGSGGGGPGGKSNPSFEGPSTGTNGTDNTGGGGGGAAHATGATGGVGGSGIVMIRYKFQ